MCCLHGRYEFQNKGADVFLESLGRLNYLLKVRPLIVSYLIFYFDLQFMLIYFWEIKSRGEKRKAWIYLFDAWYPLKGHKTSARTAGLFKYVWPFVGHPVLKGYNCF